MNRKWMIVVALLMAVLAVAAVACDDDDDDDDMTLVAPRPLTQATQQVVRTLRAAPTISYATTSMTLGRLCRVSRTLTRTPRLTRCRPR